MSPQLSYTEQAIGIEGQLADMTDGMVKDTMINGDVVSIPFGKFVVELAPLTASPGVPSLAGTPASAKLPASSGDNYGNGGFVLHSNEYDKRLELDTVGVLVGKQLNVLKRGRVIVRPEQAMLTTDPVYVRYTANGLLTPGSVRKDSDTSKATQLWGARLKTATTAASQLAVLDWDAAAYRAGAVHS